MFYYGSLDTNISEILEMNTLLFTVASEDPVYTYVIYIYIYIYVCMSLNGIIQHTNKLQKKRHCI